MLNLQRWKKFLCKTYLSTTQAGPGRTVKERLQQTSPNHVQRNFFISVECQFCLQYYIPPVDSVPAELSRQRSSSSVSFRLLSPGAQKKITVVKLRMRKLSRIEFRVSQGPLESLHRSRSTERIYSVRESFAGSRPIGPSLAKWMRWMKKAIKRSESCKKYGNQKYYCHMAHVARTFDKIGSSPVIAALH